MTNQEAIDNLKSLREFALGFVFKDSPEIVALDLAIKALEFREKIETLIASKRVDSIGVSFPLIENLLEQTK